MHLVGFTIEYITMHGPTNVKAVRQFLVKFSSTNSHKKSVQRDLRVLRVYRRTERSILIFMSSQEIRYTLLVSRFRDHKGNHLT